MSNMVTLFTQVPESDLPAPGTWIEAKLSNGMTAQIWNLREGESVSRQPRSLGYIPVRSQSTDYRTPVHATINRRRHNRNRPDWFTLCTRGNPLDPEFQGPVRVVTTIVNDGTLEDVSCTQCRAQLVEDGVLEQ